ncbi:hypothetical protein HX836_31970 [Pseudomonas yamanorum]|uniref:hypothetical protein n=1 Tax=Pseudomonas yamanorum TaxID=515393 RepID=UPI0015A0E21F|nr:hypothetical protein [Pseudomonas yamanorum]NVZ86449.1 hypothetical protein [Pseudomonas yamanorum]
MIATYFELISVADSVTYCGVIYMQVNDSSYPVGGNFGTQGIQDSGSSQPAADQGAGSSQGAGKEDLLELLRKMLMQAEQQGGSQGQGSQAGNGGGGGGQVQY